MGSLAWTTQKAHLVVAQNTKLPTQFSAQNVQPSFSLLSFASSQCLNPNQNPHRELCICNCKTSVAAAMAGAIQQLLRRGAPFRYQLLLPELRFQPKTLTPIYGSFRFLSLELQSTTTVQFRNSSYVSEMRSSAFEGKILRLLRNEIQYELERSPPSQPPAEVNGFKVDERPGEQWISLEKKFGENEEIKVEVTMFDGSAPVTKSGDKNSQLGEEVQLHITLIVSLFKEESNQVLEFICSAWPDALDINKVCLRERAKMPRQPYAGPRFRELDDELQNSLYEFLEERGIDDSLCSSLHRYMNYKDRAEYIRWMRSVKSAIEGA